MARFVTTRWSVVLEAGTEQTGDSRRALGVLCTTYWYPLYAYIRSRGYRPEDAQDLTQEFFTRFIEKDYLKDVDRAKGRFRSFLLATVRHFLSKERARRDACKRGGEIRFLSVDFARAEERHRLEPTDSRLTPEKLFDRAWALTLMDTALTLLEHEYTRAGKAALFMALKPAIAADVPTLPYRVLAENLQLSEGAVKVAVHRLRRRYGALLKKEVAQTLNSGSDVDDELHLLLEALQS